MPTGPPLHHPAVRTFFIRIRPTLNVLLAFWMERLSLLSCNSYPANSMTAAMSVMAIVHDKCIRELECNNRHTETYKHEHHALMAVSEVREIFERCVVKFKFLHFTSVPPHKHQPSLLRCQRDIQYVLVQRRVKRFHKNTITRRYGIKDIRVLSVNTYHVCILQSVSWILLT